MQDIVQDNKIQQIGRQAYDAAKEIFSTSGKKFAIANYTAVQPVRAALKKFIEGNN